MSNRASSSALPEAPIAVDAGRRQQLSVRTNKKGLKRKERNEENRKHGNNLIP